MTAAEDQAKRILRDILEMTGEDLAERRIAVLALHLEAFAASEFAGYERQIVDAANRQSAPVVGMNSWQTAVLRRIEDLERDTKSMDDAFSTRFQRLEHAVDIRIPRHPTSFLTTPRAAVEELRAVHNPHGGPGWYWWDIENHRDGSSGPFATWALAAADCQSVGYTVDNSAHRTPSVNKPRGLVRRYWSGSDGGATYTVIAKDAITAIKRIAQHCIDAGVCDDVHEVNVEEMTDERVKACVIHGDGGGPLVDMPYGMVASSEY